MPKPVAAACIFCGSLPCECDQPVKVKPVKVKTTTRPVTAPIAPVRTTPPPRPIRAARPAVAPAAVSVAVAEQRARERTDDELLLAWAVQNIDKGLGLSPFDRRNNADLLSQLSTTERARVWSLINA